MVGSPERAERPKRVLFVCTANIDRSPTAEDLLKKVGGFEVKSAGVWFNARQRLSEDLIDWADVIFAMEEHHKMAILALKPDAEDKIIVLHIPDIYPRNDPELVEILKMKLSEHLKVEWVR
ncbi:MAG: phosphotyrosine protein phosphatase [Candidatus Bathyarchaeia archaeon]|nr:phosphotyrosine protein phosphatase [Candidatus Bathyarchaeota archaeon]